MEQEAQEDRLSMSINAQDHQQGTADAPFTLVLYGDYECPYTRDAQPIVHELQRRLGEQLRFVFRNFPLVEIHAHAAHAAEAAEGADAQGQFWPMYDYLFAHQQALDDEHLLTYARDLGLDAKRFDRDLAAHTYVARVRADLESGIDSGVGGTPTFFVNGRRHEGSYDLDTLLAALTNEW